MLLLISSQLHRPGTQRRNLTNRSRGLMARRSGLRVESAADSHGMARYTHTKSRYLESKSRCRSKLSEPGPRAARRGAAPIGKSSRRERTGDRPVALWVDFAAGTRWIYVFLPYKCTRILVRACKGPGTGPRLSPTNPVIK